MNNLHEALKTIKNSNNHYPANVVSKIIDNITEGVVITDEKARILMVNPAFEFVTGYSKNEVIGKSPSILQSGIHNEQFYKEMWSTIDSEGAWTGEIWNRRKNGDIYPENLTIFQIKNDDGKVTNYCGIFTDLTDSKSAESKLEKLALTDSLTNVNNRFAYNERMNNLIEMSLSYPNIQHAVFFLDLDRFKQVNDTLGHTIGDKLLVAIAKRLKALLKNKDIIARYGGDEFVITLTNIKHPREAAKFAEELICTIEKPVTINGHEIYISTSIGISIYPVDGKTTEELVNKADKAMYYTKQNGRSGFAFYFDDLNIDNNRLLLLDTEFRKAIEKQNFTIHFQPKVELHTNKVVGLEALVRWHNEKLGDVSPNEFITYAEETGLIIPISEIIFEKVCEALVKLKQKGYSRLPISFNVSSIHFQHHSFLEMIHKIIDKNNITAHNIEVEVTERTVMNNDVETLRKLIRLKQLGIKLSIDDFGTGYSSLIYLVRFPLDALKIDRSFIQHIAILDEKQAIVDAIIKMAHRLNMKVIAEGVETIQQFNLLKKMDCDIIQGYYICKPVPFQELIEFLQLWEYEHQGRII